MKKAVLSYEVCRKCCAEYYPSIIADIPNKEAAISWLFDEVFDVSWTQFETAACPINIEAVATWSPSIFEEPPEYCPYKEEHKNERASDGEG
jgi:hypothetical protein